MDGGNRHSDVRLGHWIGLRKNLQESPIDGDKKTQYIGVPFNQFIEVVYI